MWPALRPVVTAIVAVIAVGLTPTTAGASPQNPSNAEIAAARAEADAVANQIGALAAQVDAAQKAVDDAHATSSIALDEYQATEAAYEQARARSDAAAAEAAAATARLGVARDNVIAFARSSYMQGSTDAGAAALLTFGDAAQLIERAALLEAAGAHRSDVLDAVTVAQAQASRSDAVARSALAQADSLERQASQALSTAQDAEVGARAQAAALTAQQAALTTRLAAAQTRLNDLVGARAAADRLAALAARAALAAKQAPPAADVRTTAGPGSRSAAQKAIDAALGYVGLSYAWGGGGAWGPGRGIPPDAGVTGFDCSGLAQYAYARAGISIPRNSRAQFAALPRVSRADLQPGDLVFWATDPKNAATIHHVALYLGGGRVVQAPESGDVVKVSDMWWSGYAGAVRPSA